MLNLSIKEPGLKPALAVFFVFFFSPSMGLKPLITLLSNPLVKTNGKKN